MKTFRTPSVPSQRGTRRLVAAAGAGAVVLASLAVATAPAQAAGDGTVVHSSIVSADPAEFTPAVTDGIVESVVQVGNQIVIGGTFTQLTRGTTTYARAGLAAFDATTGAVSTTFTPSVDGEVTSLEVSADGTSVYVGGGFNNVTPSGGGTALKYRKLVELNVATGAVVTAFKNAAFNGAVSDLRLSGGTLWVAGKFTIVGTTTRAALVTLDATTAAVTPKSSVVFAGLHNGGTLAVRKIAMTPAGDKLLAIGNFTSVDGQAREQVAMLDTSGATAVVSGWQTNFYNGACSASFDTYMRDVAISPDGTYAVLVSTGAYFANNPGCDSQSRFEITGTSPGVTPTWIQATGGDTTTAVAIVGSVIYVGGHFRWLNNPSRGDRAGQGAVSRTGLAALNPSNGMPYSWNPTRERKYGVYDFLATPQGLWVGSDSDQLGGESHPKIGFFPLAGGSAFPPAQVGTLPGDVITLGPLTGSTNSASRTPVSASVTPGSTAPMTSTDTWSSARGAMLIDSTLYTAWSDRQFYASTVSGSTISAHTLSNINVGPICTTGTSYCAGAFAVDVPTITGMFYDAGRMYYTMSNGSQLYYRNFEPQSSIVGAVRYQATGSVSTLNPSRVRGMFLAGGRIYFADSGAAGTLNSISFSAGVVGSDLTLVNSSRDWRARGLALRTSTGGNQPPTAVIGATCGVLSCSFVGSNSTDDGSIASYAWTFGDGQTSTSASPTHAYAAAGQYPVTLTVTDNDGATGQASYQATVTPIPTSNVSFRASATATAGASPASIVVPASVQPGDALFLFVTLNGVTTTTTPAGWTQIAEQSDGTPDMVTRVFRRAAVAGTAGSTVSVPLGSTLKSATTLVAYSGVDTTGAPVVAGAAEPGTSAAHAAPAVQVTATGSWVLSYWADKTAGTTSWTLPGTISQRSLVLGSGSGQVGGVSGDTGGPVGPGTWSGATATSSTSGAKATSFSLVLAPA